LARCGGRPERTARYRTRYGQVWSGRLFAPPPGRPPPDPLAATTPGRIFHPARRGRSTRISLPVWAGCWLAGGSEFLGRAWSGPAAGIAMLSEADHAGTQTAAPDAHAGIPVTARPPAVEDRSQMRQFKSQFCYCLVYHAFRGQAPCAHTWPPSAPAPVFRTGEWNQGLALL